MEEQIINYAQDIISNAETIARVGEDPAMDRVCHFEMRGNDPILVHYLTSYDTTIDKARSFFKDFATNIDKITPPIATYSIIGEEDGRIVAHHRTKPPIPFLAPRSMIVTYYYVDKGDGEFTFFYSNTGGEELTQKYKKLVGSDTIAKVKVAYFNFKELAEGGGVKVTMVSSSSPGGSIPKVMVTMMGKMQQEMLLNIVKAVATSPPLARVVTEANDEEEEQLNPEQEVSKQIELDMEMDKPVEEQNLPQKDESYNSSSMSLGADEGAVKEMPSAMKVQIKDAFQKMILAKLNASLKPADNLQEEKQEKSLEQNPDDLEPQELNASNTSQRDKQGAGIELQEIKPKLEEEVTPGQLRDEDDQIPEGELKLEKWLTTPGLVNQKTNKAMSQELPITSFHFQPRKMTDMIKICDISSKHCHNPAKIVFKDLYYNVKIPDPSKKGFRNTLRKNHEFTVLKNISGYILPGQTTYIMGASGCGKSTLLNVLSGRAKCVKGDTLTGSVIANDQTQVTMENFGTFGAYVQQDDILFEYMTVKEALTFTVRLKQTKLTAQQQDAKVTEVINDLGLTKCQNSLIGSVARKVISGGERKRTAIGVEMLADPSLLLLDEPTSGLDSFTALKIVKLMKTLARKRGLTILATIHQPSSQAFFHFDRLILMQQGSIVYQGLAYNAATYFRELGSNIPTFGNPTDIFLKDLATEYPLTKECYRKMAFYKDAYSKQMQLDVEEEHPEFKIDKIKLQDFQMASFVKQTSMLMWRAKINVKRNPLVAKARLIQNIVFAILIGGAFQQCGGPERTERMNMMGAYFFMSMNSFMLFFISTVGIFQMQREVVIREYIGRQYNIFNYFNATTMFEVPIQCLIQFVYVIITYWWIGFRSDIFSFMKFTLIVFALGQNSVAYGYVVTSMFTDMTIANMVAPLLVFPFMLFSGWYINLSILPWFLKPLAYVSPLRYSLEGMAQNEFDHDDMKLDGMWKPLDFFAYELDYWTCCISMFVYALILRILAFLFLRRQIRAQLKK